MSLFEFKLPDIGEGVMEGEIVAWHVQSGQAVREDDPMVEVMTDKATVTIGAPKTGTIRDVRAKVGEVAQLGLRGTTPMRRRTERGLEVGAERVRVAGEVGRDHEREPPVEVTPLEPGDRGPRLGP